MDFFRDITGAFGPNEGWGSGMSDAERIAFVEQQVRDRQDIARYWTRIGLEQQGLLESSGDRVHDSSSNLGERALSAADILPVAAPRWQ